MFYKKYKPRPTLQRYVQDYFIWESPQRLQSTFSIVSPANPSMAMVFNYGDPYYLHNALYKGLKLPRQFFSGASSSAYQLEIKGKIAQAGIIFKGSAFRDLFSLPNPAEFRDDREDLTNLVDSNAPEVLEKLAGAHSHWQRIQILESFLLQRLPNDFRIPNAVDQALNIILQQRGLVKMDDLARQVCISPRHFRRAFKSRVGMSPKFYARLKRFNYINLRLTQEPGMSWREFVGNGLFYDQSHFIKDFQAFFGRNPTPQILENREIHAKLVEKEQR